MSTSSQFQNNAATISVYPVSDQAVGAFDGGKIRETKPIGFPREGSKVRGVGPLFYWAWASSTGPAVIGMHPHEAFEILSFAHRGKIGHLDTLGNDRVVDTGGIQVMQTGSGVSHEEHMVGEEGTDFFQIWFEPDLRETIKHAPVYRDFEDSEYPVTVSGDANIKHLIGPKAKMQLQADASIDRVQLPAGKSLALETKEGRALVVLTVQGTAQYHAEETLKAEKKEFAVIEGKADDLVTVEASGNEDLELMIVEVPVKVDYPLYPK